MKIGIKAGRFEILHVDHVRMLKECRSQCDYLIVLIHDCDTKPSYIPAEERLEIIQSLRHVDEGHIYKGENEEAMVREIIEGFNGNHFFTMFHSDEIFLSDHIPCEDIVDCIVPMPRGTTTSSSAIINKIKGI